MWCLEPQEVSTGRVIVLSESFQLCMQCSPNISHLHKSSKYLQLGFVKFIHFSSLISSSGIVQLDQRNNTLIEMEIFQDGPFEIADVLKSVPANSYLGEYIC